MNKYEDIFITEKTIYGSSKGKGGMSYYQLEFELEDDKIKNEGGVRFNLGSGQLKSFVSGKIVF